MGVSLRGSGFRQLGFWTDLALSSAIVLSLFLVGRAIGQVVVRAEPRLRRFVDELTEPVLEAEGEIYQYAGDEVVAAR